MYKDLKTENIKLKQTIEMQGQTIEMQGQTIEMQGQTIEMQGQTIEELKRSVADLRRRLVRDNYNTPPSQKKGPGWPDAKKNGKNNKNNKSAKTRHGQVRRGRRQENPRRAKRPRGPHPQAKTHRVPHQCLPRMRLGPPFHNNDRRTRHTRKECTVKVITTRHTINTCRCHRCPKDICKGRYGHNCRGGRRQIAERCAVISLSTGTAYNIMRRLGESLGTPAADIAAMIHCTPTRRRFTSTATSGCGYCTISDTSGRRWGTGTA